ncbi:RNB-domain-containing protein, partial [Aureobasidium melanogenum]
MMEQLALAQQIELLQQQQQQIAATHQQYVNLGMIQPQQQLPNQAFAQMQGQMPNNNAFQFPQQQQQQQHLQLPGSMGPPTGHRRNQSAMPTMTMGPPPAPSAGSSGTFGEFSFPGAKSENVNPRPRNSGSVSGGSGHSRRHSLALPEAKKAAEIAEQKRKQSGFQFPIPGAAGATPDRSVSPGNASNDMPPPPTNFSARNSGRGGHGRSQSLAVGNQRNQRGGPAFQFPPPAEINNAPERRGSQGHGRTQSRNFDGNWRQQQPTIQEQHATNMGNFQMNQHAGAQPFQPGHRQRGSVNSQSISSISNFQFPQQPQLVQLPQGQVLMQPNMFATQGLNALQLAQIQAYQAAGLQPPIAGLQGQQGGQQMTMQQQQQQRKTLFTPYLPQATLPALLGDGQLVAGILRVNKKNRSDAYVTTNDLDADIFICG